MYKIASIRYLFYSWSSFRFIRNCDTSDTIAQYMWYSLLRSNCLIAEIINTDLETINKRAGKWLG